MFKKDTLQNGLRIITVPQKGAQSLTLLILVGTGSKYEKKEINGISHLLEHLLFKGTKKRPTQLDISSELDQVGGIYNAFTGEEYTGYYAKVGSQYFDLALDILSDMFLNSKLAFDDIVKEKSVIIEEINMYYDHPTSYVQRLWQKVLYGDQPAGWDIVGTKESVSGIQRGEVVNYIRDQYVAKNTIICLAGNIPERKLALKKIRSKFSPIKNTASLSKEKVVENQETPQIILHERQTDQTHFCLGVRSYDLFHKKRYVQEVLGLILGGMMSSRVFTEVREKLGLAYYISTEVSANTDTGFLVTQAGVDNQKADKAIWAVLNEYKKIATIKVPKDELGRAKEHIKGKMALQFEASDTQASFFGFQELLEGRILSMEEVYDKIDKVRAEDVMEVAKDIFQPQKLNLALIGPFKGKEKFKNLLKI